jgi:hypothetical protein
MNDGKRNSAMLAAPTPTAEQESTTAKFIRVLGLASEADANFIKELVNEWTSESVFTIRETTFDAASSAMGLDFLHCGDINEWEELAEYLNAIFRILTCDRSSSVAQAFRRILPTAHAGKLNSLGDMLRIIEAEMLEEDTNLELARDLLKRQPLQLGTAIREAIKRHPELVAEGN